MKLVCNQDPRVLGLEDVRGNWYPTIFERHLASCPDCAEFADRIVDAIIDFIGGRLECERCGHNWVSRKGKIRLCPKCRKVGWTIREEKVLKSRIRDATNEEDILKKMEVGWQLCHAHRSDKWYLRKDGNFMEWVPATVVMALCNKNLIASVGVPLADPQIYDLNEK